MTSQGRTFSESWHRVSGLKVGIRPTLTLRKQYFRGEEWYTLHDPFNNQFFRFRPQAYAFISRLNPKHTIEDVWKKCMDLFPDDAPGQEDVIKLLSQLYTSNLLYFTSRPDSTRIFDRYKKRRQRELQSKLMSIMFIRLPLFDPDRLLAAFLPLLKMIISPLGAIIWFAIIGVAGKQVVDHWTLVFNQAQAILAPDNLIFLYLALAVIKSFHELGHAAVCRRFGGEVHIMGVMLLIFTPLPYMDATSSWAFREKLPRVLVGAAGILVEVFLAAIACLVWVNTSAGVIHSLAYNVMFIASISTILFNINPLLRFDGYYIMSDLMDIPNLHTRSKAHMRHLVEKYAFGYKESISPTQSRGEGIFLTVFGIFSLIYRVLIFVGIGLFVADKFYIVGQIMAVICFITWVIIPGFQFFTYLVSSPRLDRSRARAFFSTLAMAALVFLFLFGFSFPHSIDSPGVLEAENFTRVFAQESGYVGTFFVDSGESVAKGDPLVQLTNRELELDLLSARAQLKEANALVTQARQDSVADLKPLRKRLEAITATVNNFKNRMKSLLILAEQSGNWHAPDIKKLSTSWVKRGAYIGDIVEPERFNFKAVVTQNKAGNLFQDQIQGLSIRLKGQAGQKIDVIDYRIIPYESTQLPSSALGWRGGGQIATKVDDKSGLTTQDPFFLITANLILPEGTMFRHGRTGRIYLSLPSKPLSHRIFIWLKQLLQVRYNL